MGLNPEVQDALEKSVRGFQGDSESQPDEAEDSNSEEPTADESRANQDSEEQPEDQQVTGDVPDEYFGVDLSGVEPEQRQAIVDRFQQSDQYINRILQEKARLEQQPPQPQEEEQFELPSDEDLSSYFGLNEEDPYYDVKRDVLLPVGKHLAQIQQGIEYLSDAFTSQQTMDHWNRELTRLEGDHGQIPGLSHDDIMQFAAGEGIADPEAAFLKLWAPAQKVIRDEAQKLQPKDVETELRRRKDAATGTRPRSGGDTEPQEIKADNMMDAVRQAVKRAAETHKTSWGDALRRYGADPEEE